MLENVPDILDVHVMLALLDDLGVSCATRAPTPSRCAPTASARRTSTPTSAGACAPRCCWPARCSPAAARWSCRWPGATSSAAAASTRTCWRSAALGAECEVTRSYSLRHNGPARSRAVPRRGLGDGHRERAHGGRHRRRAATVILNAASEPHVQDLGPLPRRARRADRRHRHQPPDHRRRRPPARRALPDRPGLHRDRLVHRPRRDHGLRPDDHRRRAPSDMRMINLTFERMGIRVEMDGDTLRVPPGPERCGSSPTRATRSRRSTTASGRPSRPT